jgi:hypothetical protein
LLGTCGYHNIFRLILEVIVAFKFVTDSLLEIGIAGDRGIGIVLPAVDRFLSSLLDMDRCMEIRFA